MTPDAADRSEGRLLADRIGANVHPLVVVDVVPLTPSMRRVVLGGDTLASFSYEPGQDLMFDIVVPDGAVVRRRYTIRAFDPAATTIAVDGVLHGDGPGARWFTDARVGDRIETIGPRGKVTVDGGATWHLFAGDESFLPAACAMAESLADPSSAQVVICVDGADDEVPGVDLPGLRYLHRGEASPADPALLIDALSGIDVPDGPGRAYLGGELKVVAAMRKTRLGRGLDAARIAPKPYWRAGVSNAPHGEPTRD
jgi:NADPH-dependent ferric siderophore reductase